MKKSGKTANSVIAIFVILILVAAFIYMRLYTGQSGDSGFNKEKIEEAEALYNEVVNYNYIRDYPETPEEVMDMYFKTVRLLYGGMLTSDDYIHNVIEKQRILLGEEILRLNSIEDQFAACKAQLEQLNGMGVTCISLEQKAPVYPTPEKNICTIRATQYNSGAKNTFFNYELSSDNSSKHWKIETWEVTDENFKSIDAETEQLP